MTTLNDSSNGLRHPLANCTECPLNQEDCIFVPGAGPIPAKIVAVGEAPGYQEAKSGKPFTGQSGILIRTTLKNAGIDPDEVYFTNACLCRPPENATPPAKAVECCSKRLEAEIHEAKPEVLLTLGNTASQSLLHTKDGITKLRVGTGHSHSTFPGVRIIPTIHPAACLRQGDMFPSLVSDIGKIHSDVSISWEPPIFKVFDDERTACAVLKELYESRVESIVVDIEVGIDKDEFDHPDRYSMLCIGISYSRGRAIVIGENACRSTRVKSSLQHLFDAKKLICHNGKFDIAGLRAYCSTGAVTWFDTMIAGYCLDERQGVHSLDYNGMEKLGSPDWKAEIRRYVKKGENYGLIPREVLYKYNAYDCAVTYMLFEYYEAELARHGLRALHDRLVLVGDTLMYPETEGVVVDQAYNDYLTDHYLEDLDEVEKRLADIVGIESFNPRSVPQVKAYLESIGHPVLTTNADQLEAFLEAGIEPEFCAAMLEQRKGQKLYGTYVKGIRKRLYRGRVHPTFLIHGTVSGRLSCRNPNLQNIPRESVIRRQFVPAEGNVFLQGDFSQAELRVMATLSEDPYLRDVLSDGNRDIFDEVGTRLYGDRAVGDKELRIRTKAYVYGISYGREEYSIAMEYGISPAEAKRGIGTFLGMASELDRWRKELMRSVLRDSEDLITTFGRHRRFWLITRENKKDVLKEALSFYPQSTANDICLDAVVALRKKLPSGAGVRIPVHDSILVECAQADAADVSRLMKQEMEAAGAAWTDFVPFPVEVEQGKSWGELSK